MKAVLVTVVCVALLQAAVATSVWSVDEEARCASMSSCASCVASQDCGWCESTKTCSHGASLRPSKGYCAAWSFDFCTASSCHDYTACAECANDPFCGWAAGVGCVPGNREHATSAAVTGEWAFLPETCAGLKMTAAEAAAKSDDKEKLQKCEAVLAADAALELVQVGEEPDFAEDDESADPQYEEMLAQQILEPVVTAEDAKVEAEASAESAAEPATTPAEESKDAAAAAAQPEAEAPRPAADVECGALSACNLCTAHPRCGWCVVNGTKGAAPRCMEGSSSGPLGATCEKFDFSFCSGIPCHVHTKCLACVLDPFCGWCAASNTCAEGAASGPLRGACGAWDHGRCSL